MRKKRFLAAILLSVALCFVVSGVGYGELNQELLESGTPLIFHHLLQARVDYMMNNPNRYLYVQFYYDPGGSFDEFFPGDIDTKDKIVVSVSDIRGDFSGRSGETLLKIFKNFLDSLYSYIWPWMITMDMNTDITAKFSTEDGTPLGYFYEGEYYLWEE